LLILTSFLHISLSSGSLLHFSSVTIPTSHLSVPTPSIISMPFLPFNPLPCHYIIMTSYYIIWRHITSHYVIHLIYVIPKIYNNQLLLQYHMYLLSIPCNNVYPSFIPRNTGYFCVSILQE